MSQAKKLNVNVKYYLKLAVYLLITFGVGFLPPVGAITPLGMKILGVFIGTIYGWIVFEMVWPSFFALCALSWIGYTSIGEGFASGLSYYMIPMMFACYIVVGVVVDSKAALFIAQWIISRKFTIGRPELIVLSVYIVAVVLGLCSTGFAGIFIVWGFLYALADAMGFDKKTPWVQYVACTICPLIVQGGQCFPFYQGAIVYNGFFQNATKLPLDFVPFVVVNVGILLALTLVFFAILVFVIRPDFDSLRTDQDIYGKYRGNKMNWDQKWGIAILVAFVVLLTLPSVLPKEWAISGLLGKLEGVLGTSIVLAIVATWIRRKDGSTYYDMAKGSTKHISWPVMWMIVATIPLADAFQLEDAGIVKTIMGFLTPLLGDMNPFLFAICCMILVGLTTQVVHNIILAIVFIPIFCNMVIGMGGNPYLVYIFMFWALNLSFMTPAASMTAVIMHGNEQCDVKYAYLYGFVILAVGMIVTVLIGGPLVGWMMPYGG